MRRQIGKKVLPFLAPSVVRLISRTWKVERLGVDHWDAVNDNGGWMATLWHGRMLVPLKAHENLGLRVLISPSDDGALIMDLVQRFGYGAVRGSSNRNPARAIREMLDGMRRGGTMVITPDGPRGPRHSVNPGPAWMAKETGFPILPCGCVCDRAWYMKSWDRFTIPKVGARLALVYGEPLYVNHDASDEEIRDATTELRDRMFAAERAGFAHLGQEPDW